MSAGVHDSYKLKCYFPFTADGGCVWSSFFFCCRSLCCSAFGSIRNVNFTLLHTNPIIVLCYTIWMLNVPSEQVRERKKENEKKREFQKHQELDEKKTPTLSENKNGRENYIHKSESCQLYRRGGGGGDERKMAINKQMGRIKRQFADYVTILSTIWVESKMKTWNKYADFPWKCDDLVIPPPSVPTDPNVRNLLGESVLSKYGFGAFKFDNNGEWGERIDKRNLIMFTNELFRMLQALIPSRHITWFESKL